MTGSDSVWERKYASGHRQRYPWDAIVSFVLRYSPSDRPRSEVSIVEVGCGTGSNLWFAAREGFHVAGVDSSASAIEVARAWFSEEGLEGDLEVTDFSALPFEDVSFDLAIDRGSITCVGLGAAQRAVNEIRRVLKPGGHFFFNPYCDEHSSAASGCSGPDGITTSIDAGSMVGVGDICFYGRRDVLNVLGDGWIIKSMARNVIFEECEPKGLRHADWRVVAKKQY